MEGEYRYAGWVLDQVFDVLVYLEGMEFVVDYNAGVEVLFLGLINAGEEGVLFEWVVGYGWVVDILHFVLKKVVEIEVW